MKVKELIDILYRVDGNAEVRASSACGDVENANDVTRVVQLRYHHESEIGEVVVIRVD